MTELSPETRELIREAVSNAYYEARNHHQTMEQAADRAVASLSPIIVSIDTNAETRGWQYGYLAALNEVMLEREDHEEPFIVELRDAAEARIEAIQ